MYSYSLIPGGYQILLDDQLYIHQPFAPGEDGHRPMEPDEAESLALELVDSLSASLTEI